MSDARHVIVKQTPTGRVRLRGVFTDEEFAKLPIVRSFGAFPARYWACHFALAHTSIAGPILALPEADATAQADLGRLEKAARRARYEVVTTGLREVFPSVAAAKARAEEIVAGWRNRIGPRGGYSHVAPKRVTYGDQPNEPGATIYEWALRHGRMTHHHVTVKRLPARGALEFADLITREEAAS